ncbi:Coproporphyrinogen oxidase [Paxillus ammoniavirescens]|nr:Coproporphyrinogen oxidase [Paxillus ammoniavirescens]
MTTSLSMRQKMEKFIDELQDEIVAALEQLDPNAPKFKRDSWVRAQGGRGLSCVFARTPELGQATSPLQTKLEKAGVNVSVVHGMLPPAAIKEMRADHTSIPYDGQTSLPFFAAGISLVIHPRSPFEPTVHANYRYFEITDKAAAEGGETGNVVAWWFGGGCDLTPSYLDEEDAKHFHASLKEACQNEELHRTFKKWCDEYFYLPHRQETRGIGGMFFDDLSSEKHARISDDVVRPRTADEIFAFVSRLGKAFIPSYIPLLQKKRDIPTDHHRRWQLLRRGRYVEFNLVYDRGTKFGLKTPSARIESILMSLPETARWEYMSEMGTEEGSEEERMLKVLKKPQEWA